MLADCPSHSSSLLLGEGSSSLKNQSLSESEEESDGESWMMKVLKLWDKWGVEGLRCGLVFFIGYGTHAVQ